MTTTDSDHVLVDAEIRTAFDRAVTIRRALHRTPEIGLTLPNTQAVVATELRALDIPFTTGKTLDSVVGVIRGAHAGPTVLLRADMDALPITEATGAEFASEIPGRMHACGHDLHTTGLLGAAGILRARSGELRGNVVLMFQPGEEGWFGARHMIDEGVLDAPSDGIDAPSRAFALHVNPWYPVGTISTRPGPILAAADTFAITMIGTSGHGSAPHAALDPIPAACELVSAIQTQVARRNPPFDPAVISVTGVNAGSVEARTAIPARAEITGTFRTHSAERRRATEEGLRSLAAGIAQAHGLRAEVAVDHGYPATVNDRTVVDEVLPVLDVWLPAGARTLADPLMGSEDFSYVLEAIPGLLGFIGTTPPEALAEGWPPDNHAADVDYDEAALEAFIRAHLAFVAASLGDFHVS